MAKKITPPEFDDLVKVFGAGVPSQFEAHLKAKEAIHQYVETGRLPVGSDPNWDWDEIALRFYVPAWHSVSLLKRVLKHME